MGKYQTVLYFIKWFNQHQQMYEIEIRIENELSVNRVVQKANVSDSHGLKPM